MRFFDTRCKYDVLVLVDGYVDVRSNLTWCHIYAELCYKDETFAASILTLANFKIQRQVKIAMSVPFRPTTWQTCKIKYSYTLPHTHLKDSAPIN